MAVIVETSPVVTDVQAASTTIVETSTLVEVLVTTPLPVVVETTAPSTTIIEVLKGAAGRDGLYQPHVDVTLSGVLDGANAVFTTPAAFIHASGITLLLQYNGVTLAQGEDYVVSEGSGAGTGFNTVTITSFVPEADDRISGTFFT